MNEDAIVELVRREVERAGSYRALAEEWGVSIPYVFDVAKGRRAPGPSILKPLGLVRVRTVAYQTATAGR